MRTSINAGFELGLACGLLLFATGCSQAPGIQEDRNAMGQLAAQGRYEEVVQLADKWMRDHGPTPFACDQKAWALCQLAQHSLALETANLGLACVPNDMLAWLYLHRGDALFRLGDYDRALGSYEEAQRQVLAGNVAMTPENLQYLAAVVDWCKQASGPGQSPRQFLAAMDRIFVLTKQGRYAQAAAEADKSIAEQGSFQHFCQLKSNALKAAGRNEEALAAAEAGLLAQPNPRVRPTSVRDRLWTLKGDALRNLGRNEEALAAYETVLREQDSMPSGELPKFQAYLQAFRQQMQQQASLLGKGVSCDLRIVRIADGAILASAGGQCSPDKTADLAQQLARSLAAGSFEAGDSITLVSLRNRGGSPRGRAMADEMADKIIGVLVQLKKFDVRERIDLRTILEEKELDQSGLVSNPAVRAKLVGVKLVVIGGVTLAGD